MDSRRGGLLNRIDRLSRDLSADHRPELRELKNEYNRIMDDMEKVSENVGSDIFDIFPSELWIQIIKDALPARGYSSALLLLTMVSRKWMQALTSVPTLWTCIDLRGSQEDSLATIEVFKRLSGDLSLKMSLYVPTRHNITLIHDILSSVTHRLCEVTIRQDEDYIFYRTLTWSVVSFLLRNQQYISGVVYIHIESPGGYFPPHDTAIGRLIGDICLPPLLRGLSGWHFLWREFRKADDYLQNLEKLESCGPLELALTDQIQLPRLTSIKIHRNRFPGPRFDPTSHVGLPRLVNLTSLTYNDAFRDALIQLITSVVPQLLYLKLRIPHVRIPLLLSCLQAGVSLRTLCIDVDEWRESDQGQATTNDRLVPPPVIARNIPSLRELTLCVLPVNDPGLPSPDIVFKGLLLTSLVAAIRILYPNAEALEFRIGLEYPTLTKDILGCVSSLNMLRRLRWRGDYGSFDFSKETMGEMKTLEYLCTNSPELLWCLRATNLLSLSCSWRSFGAAESLKYDQVRKLRVTYENVGELPVELPEDSFPSLVELILVFTRSRFVPRGGLKLTSFQTLSTITIISNGYTPHETMLCFSLLYEPEKCPALKEIRFRTHAPDWDGLFLMLEKRNFILDASVSKIHTITLPFIPNELRAPLTTLLGGRYAERPSNEDLIMGGARELIVDENVPGCVTCLLGMKAGCREKVLIVGKEDLPPGYDQIDAMSIRFHRQADPGHEDAATVEWIKQRRSLHKDFLQSLEIWGKRYQRLVRCMRGGNEMEMTEYGARLIPYSEVRDISVSP